MRIFLALFFALIGYLPLHSTEEKGSEPWPSDGWYCEPHKKTFYDYAKFQQHMKKYHSKKKEAKEPTQKLTIFDGKEMWELTPNGLRKMEPVVAEKSLEKKDATYACPYCSSRFYTYNAAYWHKKRAHPNAIYR